ncbi:N-acyl homoserine lactonase family protein [Kibdelosporangium persicum]|uniref:MBL fold hydrolase n=1 Tax=Kibdelosporangium persicum TaxID=2698649 RepID=A0ABX2FD26_9PSEU|nr:N-acyl homoserine lactonase family protein [Kibdelosporangium persicum]NRN68776.1 MBL fold hydrolase [Kibdelosporangium persicum]
MTGFEVLQVRYGERVTQKSVVLHDYASYGQPDGDLQMDYNFWVLRDASTTILLDTGYDISERDWLGEQPVISTPDALRLLDIDPAAVSMVVTSHFHYDHIGHLGLFPNAQVVAGAAEYEYWHGKWRDGKLAGEFATAEHLDAVWKAEERGRLRLVERATEVHPGVTVHPVGGHCPGELVAVVQGRSGPLILASDAAHFYEQIEHEWPFFAFTDLDEMRRALSFLNRLAAETGGTIVPGHDGRTRERFPALDGPASQVTTVLG